MSYQEFAYIYDQLMEDAPYDQWLQFMERVAKKYNHQMDTIYDLGCGTGSLSLPLARSGKKVIGIDLSEDMLTVAEQKARAEKVAVQWVLQDMSKLDLPQKADTIICFCDSLNYVCTEIEVQETFQRVYEHLQDGGFFLFDLHSLYKLEAVFGENTFAVNDVKLSYMWQCYYNEEEKQIEHELSFFQQLEEQPNGENLYKRFDEYHVQKGYAISSLIEWLEATGFVIQEITADFSDDSPEEESERILFVVQKRK